MKRYMLKFVLCTIPIFLVMLSCGNEKTPPPSNESGSTIQHMAIRTAETTAPKDTETPPEEGGYGFEEIAADMGFETYIPSEEDRMYFGDPRATKGGELVRIMPRYPATMRAIGQHSNYTENYMFNGMIFESLLDWHPVTLEYMPLLASHWKISDDKMEYWFRINPDARWSDGQPVVADDIIASWELRMDETILSPSSQLTYGKLERPVAESKYIVRVKAKELNWRNFLYFSGMYIFPAHIISDLSGTEYLRDYQYKVLPGTGPYTMLESDIKNQVSYAITRRLDYWDAENPLKKYVYNFDKVKFVVVKDNDALEYEKFKKGEQDFYFVKKAQRWAEESEFEEVQKGWVQKRAVFSMKPTTKRGYAFNMRRPPFDNKQVRYAFCYLINREKMNEELFYSLYELQNSIYAGTIYENPTNEKITYNPERAMELLAEAGWKERDSNGWLINENGDRFQIEIGIPKTIDYRVTPVQQMLREYGIDLQIKYVDTNTRWKMMMDRSFTITYEHWGGLIYPNPETSYHSRLANQDDNNNLYGFANERVDELCAMYDVEFNQQKRIEIIREIDKIVMDTRPSCMTFYQPDEWLLYWNKFSFPEYVVDPYLNGGIEDWPVLKYWWLDEEKIARLNTAMENGENLPRGELEITYWKDFNNKVKNLSQAEMQP